MKQERSQASIKQDENDDVKSKSASDHNRSKAPSGLAEPIPVAEENKAGKWVYERYNMVTTSSAFPNIIKDIADLAKRVRDEEAD